ncbi:MAG: hypothetical protein GY749_34650 [Desulfobacteraceae bacterium]|nr:hypothetical protein [Desulfobacteraceae bacterium]
MNVISAVTSILTLDSITLCRVRIMDPVISSLGSAITLNFIPKQLIGESISCVGCREIGPGCKITRDQRLLCIVLAGYMLTTTNLHRLASVCICLFLKPLDDLMSESGLFYARFMDDWVEAAEGCSAGE